MSGMRLAAGPRLQSRSHGGSAPQGGATIASTVGGLMGSVSLINLQLLGFVTVFAVSGVVPLEDMLYPILMAIYALMLSRFVFPRRPGVKRHVLDGTRLLQLYVGLGAALGLFLPLAYVLGSFTRNDQGAVVSATPHLFLLSFQILFEDLLLDRVSVSPPVRAIITLLFNGRRLHTLFRWCKVEMARSVIGGPRVYMGTWLWFGRGLAAANTAFWAFNFFCILIPVYLPKAFAAYLAPESSLSSMEKHATQPATKPQDSLPSMEKHATQPATKPHHLTEENVPEKIKVAIPVDEKGGDKKLK